MKPKGQQKKKYPWKSLHPRHYVQERKYYNGKPYTIELQSYSYKSGAQERVKELRAQGYLARVFVSRRFEGRYPHYYVYKRKKE